MAVYKCTICGFVFDEVAEGKSFDSLDICPRCKQPADKFREIPANEQAAATPAPKASEKVSDGSLSLEYDRNLMRQDSNCRYMAQIHEMAVTGKSIHAAMGT